MDWKEMLGKVRADLPEGEDQTPQQEAEEIKSPKSQLRVVVDKKGRKGKVATIVEGFTESDEEIAELAGRLKRKLGVGGSARGGEILIQGDCADRLRSLLREEGYKVK